MGLFHDTLIEALEEYYRGIRPRGHLKEGESHEKFDQKEAKAYKKADHILSEHITRELSDEGLLGKLAALLKKYREHLEEARKVLDKDYSITEATLKKAKSTEEYAELCRRQPNFILDKPKFEKSIKEALKVLREIENILKKLKKDGKLIE